MKQYAVICECPESDCSQRLHTLLTGGRCEQWLVPPQKLGEALRGRDFDGLYVAAAYRCAVIPFLDALSEAARRSGGVNAILKREDGSLYGDNTAVAGFEEMARCAGIDFRGAETLVLGGGDAGTAACEAIRRFGGIPVAVSGQDVNFNGDIARHADAAFLVNALPMGTVSQPDAFDLDISRLDRSLRGMLDTAVSPLRTGLIQKAQALGIPCANGLNLHLWQAVAACELFTGEKIAGSRAETAKRALVRGIANIVLIGMPGCGKSTLGRLIAKRTGLELIDIDREIVREAGQSIPELFASEGEAGFRVRETAAIERYARESGRVLALGGGAVKRKQNRECIRLNGFVVHVRRELRSLATRGRPLSQNGEALEALWCERAPLYAACADCSVENDGSLWLCANAVLEKYEGWLAALGHDSTGRF